MYCWQCFRCECRYFVYCVGVYNCLFCIPDLYDDPIGCSKQIGHVTVNTAKFSKNVQLWLSGRRQVHQPSWNQSLGSIYSSKLLLYYIVLMASCKISSHILVVTYVSYCNDVKYHQHRPVGKFLLYQVNKFVNV